MTDLTMLFRAGEAELLGADPLTMRLLADGDDTGGVVSAIRSRMGRATDGPPPHHHTRAPEMFFLVEGGLHVLVGDRIVTAREGDFLVVPEHTAHTFRTPDDTGVDMLFLMPGARRFDYFRLVDRIRRGEASPRELFETQERFDNHFTDSAVWREFTGSPATGGPP
ncbi:mannose-6-phosphate isomerase-like protein (cupin superfamily) [Prauserella shujinwangii]|uniref:Mannose-6-phosphate isomerase-like protein (Cupin superfamily) n=1 Tax=Prauserella shujinwangii TaxID=1453103 RepID=A0A2T0LQ26_9PSEU|nr:cupin domain-containing protein [Prauserella shujinwangii]PRX45445.1 mannose-6-phosphate isomerase-like protein (cupin superfamily) [Prauserella shujinwangii]